MAEDQIKKLEEQVKALQAERDLLKAELAKAKRGYTLADRTPISKIVGQADRGTSWIGKEVAVAAWVRTARHQGGGKFAFIELNDGTVFSSLQVVADNDIEGFKEMVEARADKAGASLFIVGTIVASPAAGQAVELKASKITVLGGCDPDKYPLAKKSHSLEYLREVGHLRARTRTISAMARVRNALAFATHKFFHERGFIYCHTPLLTASDCEGAGEMFQVTTLLSKANDMARNIPVLPDGRIDYSRDFFKRPAFLAVSGQLNGEAYACAMSNIYTFGPTFRAEESHTTRHLAEFWMIEPEIAFADLKENADIAEAYIKFVIKYALDTVPQDIEYFEKMEADAKAEAEKEAKAKAKAQPKQKQPKPAKKTGDAPATDGAQATGGDAAKPAAAATPAKKEQPKPDWASKKLRERLANTLQHPFQRLTYTEAIEILQKHIAEGRVTFEDNPVWGVDLKSEHERYIAEVVFQKPVILMNYPKEIKAFYMRLNDDGKTVAAMDILVPGIGEVVGGSQREERPDILEQRIKEANLQPEAYSWYMDLRRFGTVPHSGFGLGFERLVRYVTGLENIRDTIPFPRYPGHCDF